MEKLSVDKVLLKAKSHLRKGEIKDAVNLYQSVLDVFPKNMRAKKGLIAVGMSNPDTLGQVPPQELINKALSLYNQGQLNSAIELAKDLILNYRNSFVIWNILGASYKNSGKIDDAEIAFRKVVELKPNYPDGYSNLGVILQEKGMLDDAILAFNKALSLKSDYAEAYFNKGIALKYKGKLKEAIEAHNKAIAIKPDYAEAYSAKGIALQEQGEFAEAAVAFRKAIAIKPDYAEVHRNLSIIIKYKTDDPQIGAVKELLRSSKVSEQEKCHLHFTMAKMEEDSGCLAEAFKNYISGGKLRQKILSYDFIQDQDSFSIIKSVAPQFKKITVPPYRGDVMHTPIFILGMPRSGTTLIEHIISCHSEVKAGGELGFLSRFGCSLNSGNKEINIKNLTEFRMSYLEEVSKLSGSFLYLTDKMPTNFQNIGLICSAIPEAKIIHVKRDPAATCWSNFKSYFSAEGHGFSYNLDDTVRYFKHYQSLMIFWDQLFGDKIYHLDYDKLTVDQEMQTRCLINYLELKWEDACLYPHKNKRNVETASQIQVRERVYTGSSQVWRKFEKYLNGAFDKLLI